MTQQKQLKPTWMLYKPGTMEKIHDVMVDWIVVDEDAVSEKMADGWVMTPSECLAPAPAPTPASAASGQPTKDDLQKSEVDKNGTPHHKSIHTKNKAKNSDGSWRKKDGISDDDFLAAEAKLREILAGE